MCTAVTLLTKDHYFGRNLDLEYSYNEEVTVTPRLFPFKFTKCQSLQRHYAIIGMATVAEGYPLYYDATNEAGLSMAGLNFPGYAVYRDYLPGFDNVASFELIPWILSRCKSIGEARAALSRINITNTAFSRELAPTPLHWIISDQNEALTVEPTADGLKIYQNPAGVLTNAPTFGEHMLNLNNYMHLSNLPPVNRLSDKLKLTPYSRGMGAMGLPGDLSSCSRFIRATFTKTFSVCDAAESDSVTRFFHILRSVEHTRGCVKLGDSYEETLYSSCCNASKGIYYYTTYTNSRISAVDMHREDIESQGLIRYPLITGFKPDFQN